MKKMILVTSPPACGKTFISKQIAKELNHVVYLDKDTLIPLSKRIFEVAGEPYNRSSDFFEENIRDFEYTTILDLAFEALEYDSIVLINAPFTREVRDAAYMAELREKLERRGAKLVVIWVVTSPEVCRERMIARNSDRDRYKIEHWDEYIKGVNFNVPEAIDDPDDPDDLLLFHNSTNAEYESSMKRIIKIIQN